MLSTLLASRMIRMQDLTFTIYHGNSWSLLTGFVLFTGGAQRLFLTWCLKALLSCTYGTMCGGLEPGPSVCKDAFILLNCLSSPIKYICIPGKWIIKENYEKSQYGVLSLLSLSILSFSPPHPTHTRPKFLYKWCISLLRHKMALCN